MEKRRNINAEMMIMLVDAVVRMLGGKPDVAAKTLKAIEGGPSYLEFAILRAGGMRGAAKIVGVSASRFHEMCKLNPGEHWKAAQITRLAKATGVARDDLMDSEPLTKKVLTDELTPEPPTPPKPKRRRKMP